MLLYLLDKFSVAADEAIFSQLFLHYNVNQDNVSVFLEKLKELSESNASSQTIVFSIIESFDELNDNDSVSIDDKLAENGFQINFKDVNQALNHYVDHVRNEIIGKLNDQPSDRTSYYALYFALVQSSGYGKSRIMVEAGKKHLHTVYGCVRSKGSKGFPLANDNLLMFLSSHNTVQALQKFLAICYLVAHDYILKNSANEREFLPLYDYMYQDSSRLFAKFWDEVIEAFITNSYPDCIKRFKQLQTQFFTARLIHTPQNGLLDGKIPCEIIIVIDEAKSLLQKNEDDFMDDGSNSIFRNLRRALCSLGSRNMVLIVTDTLSSVSNFAPASSFDSSYLPGWNFNLLPTFYELLTYDTLKIEFGDNIDAFCSHYHYASVFSQGRPMWKALYLNDSLLYEERIPGLISFARRKLVNSESIEMTNDYAKIAVVAVRCGIDGILDHHLGSAIMSSYMGTGITSV